MRSVDEIFASARSKRKRSVGDIFALGKQKQFDNITQPKNIDNKEKQKLAMDLLHPEKRVQQESTQTIPSVVVQDAERRYNDARLVGEPKSAAKTGSVQIDLNTVRQELAALNTEIKEYTSSFKNPGVLRALANPVQDDVPMPDTGFYSSTNAQNLSDAEVLAALQKKRDALLAEYDRLTGGDNRTWFQKGAFEDGYQPVDVTKAVLGTKTDAQVNLSAGALGLGEKTVDAAAAVAPYNLAAEIQGNYSDPGAQAGATIGQMLASLFMGKDANYIQDQRNELAAQALAEVKPAAEKFIKKDLYDEKKVAEWIVDNATIGGRINKLVGVDAQRDSVLGEKTDALVQSAGQLAAQYGLQLVGVPWFVTSGVSSFGSEVEGALDQGATLEGAVTSGAITAGAEILTEKLFGGDLFVNKAGFDVLVDNLTKGIANKFAQKAAQFGLEAAGEGAEEWFSQRIGQFGQWLGYRHDERGLLELLYSEKALDEAMEAFLGGMALGGGMGAVNAVSSRQSQSGAQNGVNTQGMQGADSSPLAQNDRQVAAEPKSGTYEWVQNIVELGKGDQVVGETNAVSKPLSSYSTEKQHSIRSYLSAVDQRIKNFVQNVKSGDLTFKREKISDVSDRAAADIGKLLGIDVSGYTNNINTNGVQHIIDRHGENGEHDSTMAIDDDIARIGWVLENYDTVELLTEKGKQVYSSEFRDNNNRPAPQLRFIKKIDGTHYVVEAACENKYKKLWVQGTYLQKNEDVTQAPAEGQQTNHETNAQSDLASPSSNNSIPQTAPGVNTDSDQSAEPGIFDKVMDTIALGQGKDIPQTVDTETRAEYDSTINETKGGVISNERQEETRESFYRRANEEVRTVRERGKITCGYYPATDKTGRAGKTEKALQELGIPVIVHEGLEANIDGFTRTIYGAASSVAGDVVYVRNNLETDPVETAGHEAYHFWKNTGTWSIYADIIIDNIDFSSDEFIQFQKDIAEIYFGEEIGIEDDGVDKLAEEIFAYITGLVHAGDPSGEVHGFLRDYDAVKTAWDALVEEQVQGQSFTRSKDNANPTESVGAAPAWFDVNTRLQYEYGTIPEGENPVRSDDLPKKDYTGKDVSYTARTVKGAEVTPDSFVDLLNKETAEGGLSYVKITNDGTVQKAIGHITEEGWDVAKAMWHADVRAGKAGADLSATGALLLNNAAKAGDKAAWLDILHDYQLLGTNTAQGLQALRILKQLSPSDKLYMAKRSVKQMVKDMKLDTDVTIDPELEAEYNEASTDEQRDAVIVKIQKNVAQQLPTTFMEKFTALRYVNMLGNLRTQGRNIVGNITMKGTRAIHNTIAAGIEAVANKVSGGKVGRTRSATVSKAQKIAAKKDFDSLQGHILDGGKYSDNMTATGFARGVQDQKQIFKFQPLEGYRKATNWAMEQGDLIFAKDAYARALAGYLKANGITEADYSKIDPAIMDDARLFAVKEAQEATFRDTNWLSGWVSKIGRRKDTPAVGKLLSEGIMPFRKTPANVLVRAEEYSPLGVINSVVMSVQAAQKGSEVTANQVINSWAKTLTGTGLFGMGMLLHSLGLLSAGPDDDENKDKFEDLNGWQNYALTLPDGTNFTIDCFSPSAIPVLMGAQLMNEIRENGFELKDVGAALTSIADPMVEMSMLQGVNDSLENIQYADSNLGQFVINAAVSYLTQGLTNTLAGQLERSFESSRQQTYVDKDSELPTWLQRTLGKASAKTPGLDYNQIPYINAWGEEEENPSTGANLVYNLLSPSYFDKGKDDMLTHELNRLNDAQSDVNVYPSAPDKTLQIDKQDYNLSAEEYVQLAKLQGQTQKQIVEDIMSNSYYKSLSDEDKAKAIRYAYDYARDSARGKVVEEHPGITTKWMQSIGSDPAEGIIRHIVADGQYTSLSVSDASYVDKLLADLLPEKGKTNVRTIQQVEAIAGSKLSEKDQKAVLEDTLDDKSYAKYLRILALGMDTDDYADSYRTYLDEKDIGGKGTKARIIAQFQDELDVSKGVAEKLYDIYAGAK